VWSEPGEAVGRVRSGLRASLGDVSGSSVESAIERCALSAWAVCVCVCEAVRVRVFARAGR
jgi:hypothetical protein